MPDQQESNPYEPSQVDARRKPARKPLKGWRLVSVSLAIAIACFIAFCMSCTGTLFVVSAGSEPIARATGYSGAINLVGFLFSILVGIGVAKLLYRRMSQAYGIDDSHSSDYY